MSDKDLHDETFCLHGNPESGFPFGATSVPIYQSTGFSYGSAEEIEQVFKARKFGYLYSRIANPTVQALEERINKLESGIGTIAVSSGMAAITMGLLNVLKAGDTFVSGNSLFGGTLGLFKDLLSRYDIHIRYVESSDVKAFEDAIDENTKLVFLESIGNPKLDVPDIQAIADIAHKNHCPLFLDNTAASPYLFKARDFGADFIIHSVTKYLNGNGNAIGGSLTDTGLFRFEHEKFDDFKSYKRYGSLAYIAKARKDIYINMGPCLGPQNAFLQMAGIETFSLRMARHCSNALCLAKLLVDSKGVEAVRYPGLAGDPAYAVASRQFKNGYGGMLCVDLGTKEKAFAFINALTIPKRLANIGDARTLVLHPASTIYADTPETEKEAAGVTEGLVRVSVGLENETDLVEDFKNALHIALK